MESIREPIAEDIFYPSDKKELENKIDNLLKNSTKNKTKPYAIIVPHAGYEYAGDVMASAYRNLGNIKIENVVLIAPVHRESEKYIYLSESDFFETPLGRVKVNQKLNNDILNLCNLFIKNDIPHLEEHCIEVQLPFIQRLFPKAEITPVLLGSQIPSIVKAIARMIESISDEKTLFVISSNFSSFTIKEKADSSAELLKRLIIEKNWEQILEEKRKGNISACGEGCIAAFLLSEKEKFEPLFIMSKNSSGSEKNSAKVVNYASFIFSKI